MTTTSEAATAVTTSARPDDSRRVSMLLGLLFGLAGMGSSSAAMVLPIMGPDLGVTTSVAAWAISLYVLMLAVTTAVYGRISDLVGVRIPLLVGLMLMTVGALLAAPRRRSAYCWGHGCSRAPVPPPFRRSVSRCSRVATQGPCVASRSDGWPAPPRRSAAWGRWPVESSRAWSAGAA